MRPFILAAAVAASVGVGLAILTAPDPVDETIALNAKALALLKGHERALYRVVEIDEGIVISRGLSDRVCAINLGFLDANGVSAKCEVRP